MEHLTAAFGILPSLYWYCKAHHGMFLQYAAFTHGFIPHGTCIYEQEYDENDTYENC